MSQSLDYDGTADEFMEGVDLYPILKTDGSPTYMSSNVDTLISVTETVPKNGFPTANPGSGIKDPLPSKGTPLKPVRQGMPIEESESKVPIPESSFFWSK